MGAKGKIGLIGLAVMGANLARNLAGHGISTVVYNRSHDKTENFLKEFGSDTNLSGAAALEELVNSLEKPRKIWDKITPEFPRAPINKPLAKAVLNSPTCSVGVSLILSTPEINDIFIFVPVSPSGTGNTFRELIKSTFSVKRFAPAIIID